MTRIESGWYKGEHKGVEFTVFKVKLCIRGQDGFPTYPTTWKFRVDRDGKPYIVEGFGGKKYAETAARDYIEKHLQVAA